MTPQTCPAYILAGGASSRFGSDKALAIVEGQRQLLRLLERLAKLGHTVHAIADDASRYGVLGISCLTDIAKDCGPMAGLATALEHRSRVAGPGWLLLLSCDQVLWRLHWLEQLGRAVDPSHQAAVFAVGEANSPTNVQPIPGLYHTDLLPVVKSLIRQREYSLRSLLGRIVHATGVTQDNPRDWSFNTTAELEQCMERLTTDNSPSAAVLGRQRNVHSAAGLLPADERREYKPSEYRH